ncbi:MAG: maleylpyruvate isomerase family mycothiol-dependent enzyme [Acidimicrobiales bacterium]
MIEAEQADFVALAEQLTPDQWHAPTSCDGWSAFDVVHHVALHTHRSVRELVQGSQRQAARRGCDTPAKVAELLAAPVQAQLGWEMRLQLAELLIHQQDVRRAVGLARHIPSERLTVVLTSVRTRWVGLLAGVGARQRCAGLHLVADDIGWSFGAGAEVHGAGEPLLMAMSGRPLSNDLSGDGVPVFSARCISRR